MKQYILAHLSLRLNGEFIVQADIHRLSMSRFSDIFSEAARPIETILHVEPSWDGGIKVGTLIKSEQS